MNVRGASRLAGQDAGTLAVIFLTRIRVVLLSPLLRSLPLGFSPDRRWRTCCDFLIARMSTIFSALGAMFGMGGTALLATHPAQTTVVFALYSGSAAAWMTVGYLTGQRWLLASNVAYFLLALNGLLR